MEGKCTASDFVSGISSVVRCSAGRSCGEDMIIERVAMSVVANLTWDRNGWDLY